MKTKGAIKVKEIEECPTNYFTFCAEMTNFFQEKCNIVINDLKLPLHSTNSYKCKIINGLKASCTIGKTEQNTIVFSTSLILIQFFEKQHPEKHCCMFSLDFPNPAIQQY